MRDRVEKSADGAQPRRAPGGRTARVLPTNGPPARAAGAALSPATALALQRTIGNARAVARLLDQQRHTQNAGDDQNTTETTVQRSNVPVVLGSAGRPLAEPMRTEMEARLGAATLLADDTAPASQRATGDTVTTSTPPSPVIQRMDKRGQTTKEEEKVGAGPASGPGTSKSLADPNAQEVYVAAAKQLLADQQLTDEDAQGEALLTLANNALAGIAPPLKEVSLRDGGGAEFVPRRWVIVLGRNGLSAGSTLQEQAKLAGNVYHEVRHAEQAFRSACRLVRDHGRSDEPSLREVLVAMKIPVDIAQEAIEVARVRKPTAEEDDQDKRWLTSYQDESNDALQREMSVAYRMFFEAEELEIDHTRKLLEFADSTRKLLQECGQTSIKALDEAAPPDYETAKTEWDNVHSDYINAQTRSREKLGEGVKLIRSYRRIPEEADAHQLGWAVEKAFRGGQAEAHSYRADQQAGDATREQIDKVREALWQALEPDYFELSEEKEPCDEIETLIKQMDTAPLANWDTILHATHDATHSLAFSEENV